MDVLNHIRKNYRYYKRVAYAFLIRKKLDLIGWLAGMLTKDLPADEICIHASAIILQIHITIDYANGYWTTLDIPDAQHDLAESLSDIHLKYRGSCRYNLLCKNGELKTKRMEIIRS